MICDEFCLAILFHGTNWFTPNRIITNSPSLNVGPCAMRVHVERKDISVHQEIKEEIRDREIAIIELNVIATANGSDVCYSISSVAPIWTN